MTDSSVVPVPVASGHRTWHLTPLAVWQSQSNGDRYAPEGYAAEGFIHCTDSLEELINVGNRYYLSDARPYVAIDIFCDLVDSPVVYEDSGRLFPHIYGELPVVAVDRVLTVIRNNDGRFVATGSEVTPS